MNQIISHRRGVVPSLVMVLLVMLWVIFENQLMMTRMTLRSQQSGNSKTKSIEMLFGLG